jgi:uncharacterized protein (DUF342 family)
MTRALNGKLYRGKIPLCGGLKKYFTGKPCKKSGHVCERALNGNCVACKKEYGIKYSRENAEAIAAYKRENAEAIAAYNREYSQENKEAIAAYKRENAEAIAAYNREYSQENKEAIAARHRDISKRIRVGGTNTRKTAESMMRASAWRRCAETCSKEPSKPPRCPRHPKPTKPLGTMVKTF